jgi:hypothetical protein
MSRALAAAAVLVVLGGDAARRVTARPVTPWKASVSWTPHALPRIDPPCIVVDLSGWRSASLSMAHDDGPPPNPNDGPSLRLDRDGALVAVQVGDYVGEERTCADPASAQRFIADLLALSAAPPVRPGNQHSDEWYFRLTLVGSGGESQRQFHHDRVRVESIVAMFLRANPSPASRAASLLRQADGKHRASFTATTYAPPIDPHRLRSIGGAVHEDGRFVLQDEWETVSGRFEPSEARSFVKWLHLSEHPDLDLQDCTPSPADPWSGLWLDQAWDEATGLGVASFVRRPGSSDCGSAEGP